MQDSLIYWLSASYKRNEPEVRALAQDASPARALQASMNKLARRWQRDFDRLAPKLATIFADGNYKNNDTQMTQALKDAGFTVKFKMTAAMNDAYQAVVSENVGLIKSIASQHLDKVQGAVMRSVAAGRDLGTLTKELQQIGGVTQRRAALIARDQNNKATATMTATRQQQLGLKRARWRHSKAGAHPRPSHVAADGLLYDIAKGMFIDGEWIRPGEKINCRCISQAIIPGFDDD